MAINNVPFEGDDPRWKREVEKVIRDQANEIAKLKHQVEQLRRRK